uniref:Bm2549, isoform f n=1 Tax=Brugia malayi TaxID=6279 RepID=A0A1U7F0A4_BRUMA|nr:Bm2549, isoform f [Brugia malayi]
MKTAEKESLRQRKVESTDARSHPNSGDASCVVQKTDVRAISDESDADGLVDGERNPRCADNRYQYYTSPILTLYNA